MSVKTEIGQIGNYYGSLNVKEQDGKYWWGIENWNGTGWQEITKELFNALAEYGEGIDNFHSTRD